MNYSKTVKTALSLPEALYRQGEALRRRRGLSRSGLYAEALRFALGLE